MSPTLAKAHGISIAEALRKVEAQCVTLEIRIACEERAGHQIEADRLRRILKSCWSSSASYRQELSGLTGQHNLELST